MVDSALPVMTRTDAPRPDPAPEDGVRRHAPCRIDRWTPEGWATLRHYADQQLAEAALTALGEREPDALLRLVRRIEPAHPRGAAGHAPGPLPLPRRRAPPPISAPAVPGRIVGALGLVALATLVCLAGLAGTGASVGNPRSAVPAAPAAAAAPAPASADPGPVAGYWAHPGAACADAGDGIVFQPGREIRVSAQATRQVPVTAYRITPDGGIRVEHADGGTLELTAGDGGLRLVRARIADIPITPQQPWHLRLCPSRLPPAPDPAAGTAPDGPADAFRLAVRVGDDLAAALALARGLPAGAALPGGASPLDLAMAHDRPVIVAKLVAGGADPHARGPDGRTLLSRAVLDARPALVAALLAGGADPRQADADGLRPLDHAAARGDEALIDMLLAAGR